MELASIRHYMENRDCYALDATHFCIRLSAKQGDVKEIILHTYDKYLKMMRFKTRKDIKMHRFAYDGIHDYFEAVVDIDVVCLRYYFEIHFVSGETKYYGDYRFFDAPIHDVYFMFDLPQNERLEAKFDPPSWAKNAVVYQIFPSRFASSKEVDPAIWHQAPMGRTTKLPGDLNGIASKASYLKELGVDAVYLNPIFFSYSPHKYDTVDYYQIDPEFGTKEDLIALVDAFHALGIKVILDGVFNHVGTEFFAFKDVKEKGESSRYKDWFYIKDFPLHGSFQERPNYRTFSYAFMMPKLRLSNPEVAQYVIEVATYWMKEAKVDGWRLDVGDEIIHSFWKQFRKAIKAVNPEAIIIGEVWHPAFDFLEGDEWDTGLNYKTSDLSLMAKDGDVHAFIEQIGFMLGQSHKKAFPILFNLLDSHDTVRFLTMVGGDKRKMRLAAALQLLSPGCPVIYYGDEVGMEGGMDPDCRRGMLWDPKRIDADMLTYYKRLIHIRKNHPDILFEDMDGITIDEGRKLVYVRGKTATIIYSFNADLTRLSSFLEETDLLSMTPFTGKIAPFQVLAFAL